MKIYFVLAACVAFGVACVSPARAQSSFTINSGQTSTVAQTLGVGQSGTVDSGATLNVSGSKNAIAVQGTATITNSGTIEQTGSARGIRDTGSDVALTLTVTNNAGATLSAAADDAIEIQFGDDSVLFNNFGTVVASGASDQAINFNHIVTGSNTLNNHSTGQIQTTAADAVRPGINGFVYNGGSITVTTPDGDTSSSDGVDAQTNSGITISNAVIGGDPLNSVGTIEGERHGITGGNTSPTGSPIGLFTMAVTNAKGFTIQGDNGSGINIDGVGVNATTGAYDVNGNDLDVTTNEMVIVNNAGTIIGNGVTRDGDGMDVDGLVQVTNSGTIRSQCAAGDTSEGVTVGGGTITNLAGAVIEGDNTAGKYNCNPVLNAITGTGRGITLAGVDHDVNNNDDPIVPTQAIYGFSTVDNFGTIYGDTDSGIAVTGAASEYLVTIINEAGGTIEGAGQIQAAVSTGVNQATVINSGTIKADNSGVAIDLGRGDGTHADTLEIFGGSAQVTGNISGSTASPSSLAIIPNATYSYVANAIYNYNSSTGTGTTTISAMGNSFTYTGVISNFSSAEFGSGTTILTSTSINTYAGDSSVDSAGILQLDGTIASLQTIVAGALQGVGSASAGGTVEIQSGGNIHPGDTLGDTATLSTGDLTLDSGSTATFDLGNVAGSSDLIQSSGMVTIASGAGLSINIPSNPSPGSYSLISGRSIGGTFAAPTFSPALPAMLAATVNYSNTAVTLQLQAVSGVSLQSSQNPSNIVQSVIFTANVTGSSPGGTVTFLDGSTNLGTAMLSGGTATFTTSILSVGTHNMTAIYGGDSNNTVSTSGVVQQQVSPATSTVAVNSSNNPSQVGLSVTFTATVSGVSPSGTVTFFDGATTLGTETLSGGIATFATSSLSVGWHGITATYSGDAGNTASTSPAANQHVKQATSGVSVSSSERASTFGQAVTFTATVTGQSPTGTVNFDDGATTICPAVAVSAGTATCATSALSVGAHAITAMYSGDADNLASASFGIVQTVQPAPTTTAVSTACTTTFVESQAFTVSATVIGESPSGTVTFSNGTDTLCGSIALTAGSASCETSSLAVTGSGTQDSFNLVATYSGDTNNAASASPALTLRVLSAADVVFRNGLEAETVSCPIE